ncbi:MAG: hypothetical protein LBF80_05535 [Spirochaetaceae bacterium]|jgi:hypothetical protein|nr:hypothetical protein [Spirochaetaceae bacterium]
MLKQSRRKHILRRSFFCSLARLMLKPLWKTYFPAIKSILCNFFCLQYKAVLFPKTARVSRVDHPLDERIPFTPSWIKVYMDFSPFWIRTQAFLSCAFGAAANPHIACFVRGIGELYAYAAVVYQQNFSTTRRPFYLGKPGFISIHILDPHLMCIPSLHVMVVIMTYTKMRQVLEILDSKNEYAGEIELVRRRALDITESILYVKQHSINCIAAALYAMTCFDRNLFPQSEAHDFVDGLFAGGGSVSPPSSTAIKKHILDLYHTFLEARLKCKSWEGPLLDFLANAGMMNQDQADSGTLRRYGEPA